MFKVKPNVPKVSEYCLVLGDPEMLKTSSSERQEDKPRRWFERKPKQQQQQQQQQEAELDRVRNENERLRVQTIRSESEISRLGLEIIDYKLRLENANRALTTAKGVLNTTFENLRQIHVGASELRENESDNDMLVAKARLSSLVSDMQILAKNMHAYSKRMMKRNACGHISSGTLLATSNSSMVSRATSMPAVRELASLAGAPSALGINSTIMGSTQQDKGDTVSHVGILQHGKAKAVSNIASTCSNVDRTDAISRSSGQFAVDLSIRMSDQRLHTEGRAQWAADRASECHECAGTACCTDEEA